MDCIGILEGFCQFKEKCHENNEYLQTQPPKDNAEDSVDGEVKIMELEMDCDYLEEDDTHESRYGEKLSLVKDEPPGTSKKNIIIEMLAPRTETLKSSMQIATKRRAYVTDPLDISGQVKIVRKQMAKPLSSSCKDIPVPKAPVEIYPPLLPKFTGPQPTDDELPKLLDSYPNYFHFEKTSRSLYFDLSYYGERYNSAIYGPNFTYWQCAHRRRFRCPAVVHVKNDYTHFERRFEHTHDQIKKKGKTQLLTPRQALPVVFRICWNKVNEKKSMREHFRKYKNDSMKDLDIHDIRLIKNEAPASDSDYDDY